MHAIVVLASGRLSDCADARAAHPHRQRQPRRNENRATRDIRGQRPGGGVPVRFVVHSLAKSTDSKRHAIVKPPSIAIS